MHFRVLMNLLILLTLPTVAYTKPDQLFGDPGDFDYGKESDKVCCVDAAVVNMFNYVKSDDLPIVDPSDSIKSQQESFHKLYDPEFTGKYPSAATIKASIDKHLSNHAITGAVKIFDTKTLDYSNLVKEWQSGELIILLSFIQNLPGTPGHATFLWGLDDDPKNPRLNVVDQLIHPNTNQKIPDENYFDTKSKGTSTWANLTIGSDALGPYWDMSLNSPKYEYDLGQGRSYEYPAAQYQYRVRGFISISDLKALPEPGTVGLVGLGLVLVFFSMRLSLRPLPQEG